MQACHIESGRVESDDLLDDLVETQSRGVDHLCVVRAQRQQLGRDQTARVQAGGALGDDARSPQRDQVRGARSGADEVDCHCSSLSVLCGLTTDHCATGSCGRHAVNPPSGSPR